MMKTILGSGLLCLLCMLGFSEQAFAVPLQVLGNPIGLNVNIANQPIKTQKYGVPFVAGTTGNAHSVVWWARWGTSGYSKGTGGDIKVSIFSAGDDGFPDAELVHEIKEFDLVNNPPSPVWSFTTTPFDSEVELDSGEKYWIVFENVYVGDPADDSDTKNNNFISLNGPFLRNSETSFGGPFGLATPFPAGNYDGRAFGAARPCGDSLYLHRATSTGGWIPYGESNAPRHVAFPHVLARIDDGTGALKSYGFPFAYGPTHSAYPSYKYVDMPKVGGSGRILQIANFTEGISQPRLNVFAGRVGHITTWQSPDHPPEALEERELAVLVDGVFQGCVLVDKLGWYSVNLGKEIQAGVEYRLEFLAPEAADILIMSAPVYSGGQTALGYTGKAQLSTDKGESWTGYPVGAHTNVQTVQLSFYIDESD